jgi:phosphate-selective porin OprO/OprP
VGLRAGRRGVVPRQRPRRLPLVGLFALGAILLVANPAFAQRPSSTPPPPRTIFRWNDHPEIRAGIFRLAFLARVQSDLTDAAATGDDVVGPTLDVAKRRVGIEGRITSAIEFEVEYETADPDDPWRDVFVNFRKFDIVQVRAGKFKLPFSLDETTSATNLDFVNRSLAASTLAPGRDIGVMVHGRIHRGLVRYEIGAFEHDGRNAKPRGSTRVFGGRTIAGRIGVQPFDGRRTPFADLLFGAAWADSDVQEGFSSLRGETVFGADFYDSDYWVQGARRRRGLEARWRPGPFSVKWEAIDVRESRVEQSVDDRDLSPLRAKGWYLSGTWALTGEAKADGLNRPRRPFLQGGPGAIELSGRVERLAFDSVAKGEAPSTSPRADVVMGNAARVVTVGVNWYWNRWVKMQFNLVREALDDPAQGPLPARPVFWNRVLRLQFTL